MVFDVYDDYEQSECVQKWLCENGVFIVVGIVIGLIGIFGWQQWCNYQVSSWVVVVQLYQQVQFVEVVGNIVSVDQFIDCLQKDFSKLIYVVFVISE